MKKNTADQKWRVYAWNRNTNVPATGIAATITATINKDFAGEVATDDANPTEIGGGYYDFALLQAETNAYQLSLKPTTAENGVGVRACPESLSTETADSVTLAEKLVTMIVLDGAVYDFTAAALAAAPSGSGLSAQEVRDAMKLAPTAGVPAEGSVDKHLDDLVTAVAAVPTAAEIDTQLSGTHGAGTWGSSGAGTGTYACTWTVNDGTTVLQGATVSFWLAGVLRGTGTTDASGEVSMSLDAGTYTVAISLSGYTFASTTHTVSATASTWTKTFSMTAASSSITPPSDVSLCTVQFRVKLGNTAVEGAVCTARLGGNNQAADGVLLSNAAVSATTDASGIAELQLVRQDVIVKGRGVYKITIDIGDRRVAEVDTAIPAQATVLFEDLID